jgi:hypothetical protein
MSMEGLGFLAYSGIKALAYMAWCGWGARLHGHRERLWLKGFLFGFGRLAMGAVLGLVVIFFLVNALSTTIPNQFLLYLAVYVPVRWFEWSVMAILLERKQVSWRNFLLGETASSQLWRLGGIAISCLADIPMMIALGGLPVGRFMC